MSISSQKVVSKPIGLHEVAKLLDVKAIDVGACCCAKTKINPWSKHKPLDVSIYQELTEEQMAAANYGLDLYQCAVGTINGQNVGGGLYAVDQLGVQAQTWVYHSPADSNTAKYRVTDFNGYKHKGQAYRWPVRFFPITETMAESAFENIVLHVRYNSEMAEVSGYDPFAIDGEEMTWTINPGVRFIKSYGREAQNTRPTYTGIHVASWGYAGLTTRIKGYHQLTLVDDNGRTTYDSGKIEFEFRQNDSSIGYDPDPYDSLGRAGLSVDIATKTRGKGPWKASWKVVVTDMDTTCQTIEKCQLQLTPIFSMASYGSTWSPIMSLNTGFGVRIPECSGDWAENNHAYEKELLHYIDPSTGETVYCTDPMFIMSLNDENNNFIGYRYWFPTASGNGDYVTPWSMGFGVYGDLRTFELTGLYMFYCNKEKVYRQPSGGQAAGTGTCTDTINTTDTVIFPAPYCKWDWDAIKKS